MTKQEDGNRQVLPMVAKPISYRLEINPDPVSLEFNGIVEITIAVLKDTTELYLNVNEVEVDNISAQYAGEV